jgi:predicted RNase H-like nuclease
MMRAVGIDGCKGGWIAVCIDKAGRRCFNVLPHIDCIIRKFEAEMVMIDIPIGLPESGYRACDMAAREMLGSGRSRVFLGVQRPLLAYPDDFNPENFDFVKAWNLANERAKSECGGGISRQLFGILPKIKEVDKFIITNKNQNIFRETHPELVFHRLSGGICLPNKKQPDGKKRRRDLLAKCGFEDIDAWLSKLSGSGAMPDDLLDACACAIAADSRGQKLECDRECDAQGLRMEMWF